MARRLLDFHRLLKGAPARRSGRAWLAVLASMLAVGLAALTAAAWLVGTAGGLAWLAGRLPGVTASGIHGRLLGPFGAESLRLRFGERIVSVRGLNVDWRPAPLLERRLEILRVSAAAVEVAAPPGDAPPEPPARLALPLDVVVGDLRIDAMRVVEDGRVRFAASAIAAKADSDAARHRVLELRATHDYGLLLGAGEIATQAPFALRAQARFEARADVTGLEAPHVTVRAEGDLSRLSVHAEGEGAGLRGTAELRLHPFAAVPLAALRAAVAEFDPRALSPRLPRARLTLSADLQARPDGRLAGPLRLRNAAPAPYDRGGLPIASFAAQAEVGADGRLMLDAIDLATRGGGRVAGSAAWRHDERTGTADLRVTALDLAALDTRLRRSRLSGRATLAGGIDAQQARLALADGALRIDAELVRSSDELTVEALRVRLGRNRIDASGRIGGRGNLFNAVLEAPELGAFGPGFEGRLSARARLSGDLARPDASIVLSGRSLRLFEHRLAAVSLDAQARGQAVEVVARVDGYDGGDEAKRLQRLALTLTGRRERHELRVEGQQAPGRQLRLEARGGLAGDFAHWRELRWRGSIETLTADLPVVVRLMAPAQVELARERVAVGGAALAVGGGHLDLEQAEWTPGTWRTRGRFGGVALRLVAERLPPDAASLRVGGSWDLTVSGAQLSGRLEAAREAGDWVVGADPPLTLGIADLRLDATAAGDRIEAHLSARGERLGRWQGDATLRLPARRTAFDLPPETVIDGRVDAAIGDLAWVGAALGGDVASGGRLDLRLAVGGTLGAPALSGRLDGSDLTVGVLDEGVRLTAGELAADFDASRLRVERLRFAAPHAVPRAVRAAALPFAAGAGTLDGSGEIDLRTRRGRLDFVAARLPLSQRDDRWIVVSGKAGTALAENRLGLSADLVADAGFIAEPPASRPQLAGDVIVAGREKRAAGPRLDLVADIDLGRHFQVRASGLEGRLEGRLHVVGECGQPLRATGSITAVDATYTAYGQALAVERGIVNFQGAIDDPGLNVLALRKGLAVEAGVEVTGTARAPRVRLVSTPPVSDSEKLSWIVLGRPPEAAGADSGLLVAAAGALLGGPAGRGPTQQLAQAFGVDELGLRSDPGAEGLAGQIVTVGKRLSSRATVGYEQGLAAAAGVIKLTYQLTPRVSVVTRAGADSAIDLYYTVSFD